MKLIFFFYKLIVSFKNNPQFYVEDKKKEIQSSKSFATKLFKFKEKEVKKKNSEAQPKKKKIKEKNTNSKKQSKFKKLNVPPFHFYNLIWF